jgi:L-aspartate oxidase
VQSVKNYDFDFLIIGSGLAGLYASIYSSKFGKVALVTKTELNISNTSWAQGGIAAAVAKDDSPEIHFQDTMKTGRGLCNDKAVKILVNEGVDRIHDLIDLGMKFDKKDGEFELGKEGGHSRRRVLHAGGNATGIELVNFLIPKVKENNNIVLFENIFIHSLLVHDNECFGAAGFDFKTGTNIAFNSKSTFIATGGAAGIFERSTNPETTTGDGIAIAFNAGAEVANMEFIQFHPTAFYSESGKTFLIGEALRGEGAQLLNTDKERFMPKYSKLGELSPRDVVSRSVYKEINKAEKDFVYLKASHLKADYLKDRFKNIYEKAQKFGVDITKDLIPIAPSAHYLIGGIRTNLSAETNIAGLFSFGEAAITGINGANRLASNSLLECLVFGKRAVDESIKKLNCTKKEYDLKFNSITFIPGNEEKFQAVKKKFQKIMTKYVGIVRDENSLNTASEKLVSIKNELSLDLNELNDLRIKLLFDTAHLTINSALLRKESRGTHLRDDYPDTDDNLKFHIVQSIGKEPKFVRIN